VSIVCSSTDSDDKKGKIMISKIPAMITFVGIFTMTLVTAIAENITPAATGYPSAEVYQSASEHRSPRACLQTMSLNRNKRANSAKSDSMRDTVLQLTGTSGNPRPDTDTINPDCCRAKLCCL
jgi:hypothetical protein